jgi:hypothetical protein
MGLLFLLGAGCRSGAKPAAIQAGIGPFTIDPGQELTQCVVLRVNNPDPGFVRHIRADLGPRSHHMTIYRSADTEERREPFACRGFDSVLEGDLPLFIAQQERAEMSFPSDESGAPVGFAFDARQMVRLEMHYLNTTPQVGTAEGSFLLDLVPSSSGVVPADIAFWGTVDIHIPPQAAWKTGVKFVEAPPDYRTFAMTTHQHHLGTRMRVWHADDAADIASDPLVDSRSWSDPPVRLFDPPLRYGPGSKTGLAYQCEWNNTTADTVTYGEGFHNEMCFVWHYYFPGMGFDHIVQP